ncbi:MAG: tetratricopeptide repeat protein [Pseudomonadota bacterium]|nr:tetratricopeptide repeat protein [Pseudomonadota bacterium]
MNGVLRNSIRERLGRLQSDNDEALFEEVCAELARIRIHANIRRSAFVAGHGDRGRDFENIPGSSPELVKALGQENGVVPNDRIVFACTLGRVKPKDKVKSDVHTIHEKGPKLDWIFHFCETDFPTAEQTELRKWCADTYGTHLEILTGNVIADLLAEPDLVSARRLLEVGVPLNAPFVLPSVDTQGFVGRQEQLDALTRWLTGGEPLAGGHIAGIHGSPGVGKSGLAVYFAQTCRERFPDGVVGIDLRGIVDPASVVARLATALRQPLTPEEQDAPPHQVMQTRFAALDCLILLDNLENGAALKALKPGGRSSLLITCRNRDVLAQFAVPAEHCLPLEPLTDPEAREYIESALGPEGMTESELIGLVEVLRNLPLALRIATRRLLEDPVVNGRISRFLTRLNDTGDPLRELVVEGEADLDLIRLFALSLEVLPEADRRAFACLSVCATADFGIRAAAAAMARSLPQLLLSRLVRLSLLDVNQETARYRFHALLDDYARRLAEHWGLTESARRQHAQAMAALLRDSAEARGDDLKQLLAEQSDVCLAAEYLAAHGRFELPVLQGLNCLVEQSALGKWHENLLKTAHGRLDQDSRQWSAAVLLLQRGKRWVASGKQDEARQAFEESLVIERRLKNERGEAMVLNSLGGVLRDQGRMDEARQSFEDSLVIERRLKDERGEAMVLNSLGWWYREQGDPARALQMLYESEEINRRLEIPHPDFFKDEKKILRRWLVEGRWNPAQYHFVMAKRRIHSKDWPGAIIHMRHNLGLDKSDSDYGKRLENLAYACFKAERRQESIAAALDALAAGYESTRLQANLGHAMHLEGQALEECERHLGRATELDPDNSWAWAWLGLLLADLGRLAEGEFAARKALTSQETHAVLLHNLAVVLSHYPDKDTGKLDAALDCCERAQQNAGFPFPHPVTLAEELRRRLGHPC